MGWADKMLAKFKEADSVVAPSPAVTSAPSEVRVVRPVVSAGRPRTVLEAANATRMRLAAVGVNVGKLPLPCDGCISESAKALREQMEGR